MYILQKKKGKKPSGGEGESQNKGELLSNSKGSLASASKTDASSLEQSVQTPEENSDLWWKAHHNLLAGFESCCLQLSIPCFVSSVDTSTNTQTTPAYR